jgi:hypothetical protein
MNKLFLKRCLSTAEVKQVNGKKGKVIPATGYGSP